MNPPKPSQAFEGASRVHADMQDVYGAADASHEPDAPHEPLNRELFAPALLCVKLQGPVDLDGFRRAARSLLARQVPPGQLSWNTGATPGNDLFSTPEAGSQQLAANAAEFSQAPVLKVPPSFVALCKEVVLHSDNGRFDLLYRLLWRLVNEPGLRHDPLDADMAQAQRLAQAVRRDMHKMKAFVRFRSVQDARFCTHPQDGPLHVAWFEPEHHIVEAVAPFFARRFAQMRWAILTPALSVRWDGVGSSRPAASSPPSGTLHFGPGARKDQLPDVDAGEQLWLTYYRHTFNPARLKLKAMQKEMPRKYWRNLPEASLISELSAQAHERSSHMLTQPASQTRRRLPAAPSTRTRP